MHKVEYHKVNTENGSLTIRATDEPGFGGANHAYEIFMTDHNPIRIVFQSGPIKEYGVNGLTEEALLSVVIDRLQCFQQGEFSCRENALALTKMEEALHWMHARTRERTTRGVEGKYVA